MRERARLRQVALLLIAIACGLAATRRSNADIDSIVLRGHAQTLHLYGPRDGRPCIVSSGDGGWIHLSPRVSELLAAHGYFVVGFDTRAYLGGFTTRGVSLSPRDVPDDFRVLTTYASDERTRKPLLIGVSEGAGLSVLAASDPSVKPLIGGVVGIGLGDRNELGWRWRDSIIYLTKGMPNEPWFSVQSVIGAAGPLPLAAINATHDEFVPENEIHAVMTKAHEPKRLWLVPASDHRFSDAQTEFARVLLDALAWIDAQH